MRLWHLGMASLVMSVAVNLSCTKPVQPADEVLVEGDGIRITKQDFDQYVAQIPPYAREQYSDEKLLDFYIKGELAYLDALRTGLDRDPTVRRAIDLTVKQLIQKEYNRRELNEKMGIADAEVRAYYEQHREEFRAPQQRKCWHVLTRTRDDAERARAAVLGGEAFRDVALRFSIDEKTRDQGGRIGIFSRDQAPQEVKVRPVLLDSLFSLAPGHVSEVVETDLGFHVLKADPAKRMPYLPVDSVAKQIRERILVPDSLVARHYADHGDQYMREDKAQIRVVVVARKAEAERVRERILSGEDMGDLARELSTDTRTSYRSGLLDWVRRGIPKPGLDTEVDAVLWDVPEGDLGPVVKTATGYTVFRVEHREHAGAQSLDEVRERIRGQLLTREREQSVERAFQSLRDRYRIRVNTPGRKATMRTALDITPSDASAARAAMGEEELFQLAADETAPAKRLEIYREIGTRFPKGERADDSQFMIAFVLLDELADTAGGVQAYRELIQRFPTSDWVDDAQAMLKLVSTDPQE